MGLRMPAGSGIIVREPTGSEVNPVSTAEVEWVLEHMEATGASPAFVWTYWTDVTHWDDPPASFALEGAFESGSHGTTTLPGATPLEWVLSDVRQGQSYRIESELPEARLVCEWSFEARPEGGTTLRQRIGVTGPGGARQAEAVREGFGPTLAAGMQRIARLLGEAEASARGGR